MDPRTCAVGVRSKIDESGNFLKFQGITVVASANSKVNLNLWQHLHDSLSSIPIVTNHFSLLPIESYHMTTMSVCSQKLLPDDQWVAFIDSRLDWFKKLQKRIVECEFHPSVVLESIEACWTLRVILRLDEEQRRQVQDLAREFDLEFRLPASFHVTLGYQFAEPDAATQRELKSCLDRVFEGYRGRRMQLGAPHLCYFRDMTQFTAWTAERNPYIS